MSNTDWTNCERAFRIEGDRFYKRSFRPSEFIINWQNKRWEPPLRIDRLKNEAACLRFLRENTEIPVPDVLEAYEDNEAFILVTRLLPGVMMADLSPEQQSIVMIEVDGYVKQLQTVRSTRIGGPTGIMCPPRRATSKIPGDEKWPIGTCTEENLVFCHCDLSQTNIIVDPETLKIEGIIDWEYGGFWPDYFDSPFYRDPRPSGAQFRCESGNEQPRKFLRK